MTLESPEPNAQRPPVVARSVAPRRISVWSAGLFVSVVALALSACWAVAPAAGPPPDVRAGEPGARRRTN
jgi:hypothetical protein